MKKLVLKKHAFEEYYPDDVGIIVDACAAHGYEISRDVAQAAWQNYSDSVCAGWIMVKGYTKEHIFELIRDHTEEE